MSTLGPGDVESALAAYGPLTDVWAVKAVTGAATCTVELVNPGGAIPYVGPSLQPHYVGALVRFTTGVLSGVAQGIAYGSFNTTITTIKSQTDPAETQVTFGDDFPTNPQVGDTFTIIRAAGIGTSVTTEVSTGTVSVDNTSLPVAPATASTVFPVQGANGNPLPVSLAGATVPVQPASNATVFQVQAADTVPVSGSVEVTNQGDSPVPNVPEASNNLPGGSSYVANGTLGLAPIGSVPTTATDVLKAWPHNTLVGLYGTIANVGSTAATLTLTLTNDSDTSQTLTLSWPVSAGTTVPIQWSFPLPVLLFASAASITVAVSASAASTLEADCVLVGV